MEKSQADVVTQDKVGATTKVTAFEVAGVKFAAVRTLVPIPHWRVYAARDTFVAALKERGNIEPSDLSNLDRLGRFKVADECWDISSIDTRQALLDDPHHQVRSAAVISNNQKQTVGTFDNSLDEATAIGLSEKGNVIAAQNEYKCTFSGKVLGVTGHHVVQSIGRSSVVHEKRHLDRVPGADENLAIAYDGKGLAKVDPKSQDKAISR